jgi:hypothetical protein
MLKDCSAFIAKSRHVTPVPSTLGCKLPHLVLPRQIHESLTIIQRSAKKHDSVASECGFAIVGNKTN